MSGFSALLRKEFLELWRTRRLIVLGAAFLLLGAVSPLTAKYMPLLIKSIGSSEDQGFAITALRDPVAADALFQYIKNFMLLPILAVLLSMSAISGEFSRNIAQLVLVKPVSNTAYVASKLVTLAIFWFIGLAFSSVIYLFYTYLLFDTVPDVAVFMGMNLGFWALLTLFSAFTLLSGSFLESPGATAGAGIGFYVVIILCGQSRGLSSFLPSGLNGSHIATGEFPLSQFATTLLLTALFAALAVRGVRNKRTG